MSVGIFAYFLFMSVSSAPKKHLALADTQQIFFQWMNGSALCSIQRDVFQFPSGKCVERVGCSREALGLSALRQVGMCCVCANCSPEMP